jgi:hypothetical protein
MQHEIEKRRYVCVCLTDDALRPMDARVMSCGSSKRLSEERRLRLDVDDQGYRSSGGGRPGDRLNQLRQ